MAFMEPEIQKGCIKIETTIGSEVLPLSLVGRKPDKEALSPYLEGEPDMETLEVYSRSYCARLSASGYLDCTDWQGPYGSVERAEKDLAETYDLCQECWESECECEHDGEEDDEDEGDA